MPSTVRVGLVGTSWWADAMYLPALAEHPVGRITAICGRDAARAETVAERWQVPTAYDDWRRMLDEEPLDALIVATTNEVHHPISMAALERDLHVLCEKPLAMDLAQAEEMTRLAQERGRITLVPFTYRYMPTTRYLKRMLDEGAIGRPYTLNLRYYTGYAREPGYRWRFNRTIAGTGVIGDIGAHFLDLAGWFYGPVAAVTAVEGQFVERPPVDPDGKPYEPTEESAFVLLEFESGAQGVIHVTALAIEPNEFGQRHAVELHGSGGALESLIDWDREQRLWHVTEKEGRREVEIPDEFWGDARRDRVTDTYRDVFRTQETMTRAWATAIAENRPIRPDFADGLANQRLIIAAHQSARTGRRVVVG